MTDAGARQVSGGAQAREGGQWRDSNPGAGFATARPSRGPSERRGTRRHFPPPVLDLTVVVPYYNPGPVLRATVERAVEVLSRDGDLLRDRDRVRRFHRRQRRLARGICPDVVVQVVLPHAGKGKAVRAGLARGRGRYLGFIDGDGDVPPELLAEFVEVVRQRHPDVVLGSKRHPDSQVVYPLARRLYSWGYQQLVRVLFHLDVRDTQAGIKLVRREVLAEVLPLMVEEGYAFDLEMLVLARRLGHRDLVEAPVRIGHPVLEHGVAPRGVRHAPRHLRHLVAAPLRRRLRSEAPGLSSPTPSPGEPRGARRASRGGRAVAPCVQEALCVHEA